MTCQWHQGRLPCCTHHHRGLHNLFITPNWNSVPINLFAPSSPCPEQLPFCSVAVNLTVLGPSYNNFSFNSWFITLCVMISRFIYAATHVRVAPDPTLTRVSPGWPCTFCHPATSVYKCLQMPPHTKCHSFSSSNNILLSVSTIFVCLFGLIFSSVFDIYLWCWGLNPGSHTCLGMYSTTGAPPSAVPFVFILRETALNTGTRMSESPLSELLALQLEVELLDPKRFHLKCFQ